MERKKYFEKRVNLRSYSRKADKRAVDNVLKENLYDIE